MVTLTNPDDKIYLKVVDMMKEIEDMRVKYDEIIKCFSEIPVGNI